MTDKKYSRKTSKNRRDRRRWAQFCRDRREYELEVLQTVGYFQNMWGETELNEVDEDFAPRVRHLRSADRNGV